MHYARVASSFTATPSSCPRNCHLVRMNVFPSTTLMDHVVLAGLATVLEETTQKQTNLCEVSTECSLLDELFGSPN